MHEFLYARFCSEGQKQGFAQVLPCENSPLAMYGRSHKKLNISYHNMMHNTQELYLMIASWHDFA